ncbi:hypothetical protein CBM2595_A80491 [Cupriavidus taiwanensis]|nr:hypothetical protein CBM2595_A80491 [Cupriavidus taiwanensis]
MPGAVQAAVPAHQRHPAGHTDGLPAGRSRFRDECRPACRQRAGSATRSAAPGGRDFMAAASRSQPAWPRKGVGDGGGDTDAFCWRGDLAGLVPVVTGRCMRGMPHGMAAWCRRDGKRGETKEKRPGSCDPGRCLGISGRSDRIRTYDPLIPNQMRYQAALRSEAGHCSRVGALRSMRVDAGGHRAGRARRAAPPSGGGALS